MNNSEILEKAIQKAIDGGLPFDRSWSIDPSGRWVIINLPSGEDSIRSITHPYEQVIFNHDFAKALWGIDKHDIEFPLDDYGSKDCGNCKGSFLDSPTRCWQYHLQQMVIAEDTIKYLGENL